MEQGFRSLPSVDKLLTDGRLSGAIERYSHGVVADVARQRLAAARERIARGAAAPSHDELIDAIEASCAGQFEPFLRPVINATGVIIHTNLGRAPLSREALGAIRRASESYSNLEIDLGSGERGSRHVHVERLLRRLTGADDGLVVNNNAAAVMLVLTAFAQGHEVIVSRGEAVEIGGGFRIPEILAQSGARLREIGTTNRTYLADYEHAVTPDTAAFLSVHPSNFRVSGFTHAPALSELAQAAARHKVLLVHDLGSGCLLDSSAFGLAHEPTPQESIVAGADLVCFSGDKLLGGPQAGIIVGRAQPIKTLKGHPLVRALRVDKLTLSALETTLLHYVKGEALEKVPVWRMIATPVRVLDRRARRWARAVGEIAKVQDGESTIGGGSLPSEVLPTRVVAIEGSGGMLEALARHLRQAPTPVIARIERDALILDPRTVEPRADRAVIGALKAALPLIQA